MMYHQVTVVYALLLAAMATQISSVQAGCCPCFGSKQTRREMVDAYPFGQNGKTLDKSNAAKRELEREVVEDYFVEVDAQAEAGCCTGCFECNQFLCVPNCCVPKYMENFNKVAGDVIKWLVIAGITAGVGLTWGLHQANKAKFRPDLSTHRPDEIQDDTTHTPIRKIPWDWHHALLEVAIKHMALLMFIAIACIAVVALFLYLQYQGLKKERLQRAKDRERRRMKGRRKGQRGESPLGGPSTGASTGYSTGGTSTGYSRGGGSSAASTGAQPTAPMPPSYYQAGPGPTRKPPATSTAMPPKPSRPSQQQPLGGAGGGGRGKPHFSNYSSTAMPIPPQARQSPNQRGTPGGRGGGRAGQSPDQHRKTGTGPKPELPRSRPKTR